MDEVVVLVLLVVVVVVTLVVVAVVVVDVVVVCVVNDNGDVNQSESNITKIKPAAQQPINRPRTNGEFFNVPSTVRRVI
mgnify:FL=1